MTKSVSIRPALESDAEQISKILNSFIKTGTNTVHEHPYSPDEIKARLKSMNQNGYGAFIAEKNDILGFSWYQQFRGASGYRFSMEHSVYVNPEAHGKGIGLKLYKAIEDDACERGYHSFTAVITSNNTQSINFHLKNGFSEQGRLPQNAYKFGQWFDIVFLYKFLQSSVVKQGKSS